MLLLKFVDLPLVNYTIYQATHVMSYSHKPQMLSNNFRTGTRYAVAILWANLRIEDLPSHCKYPAVAAATKAFVRKLLHTRAGQVHEA